MLGIGTSATAEITFYGGAGGGAFIPSCEGVDCSTEPAGQVYAGFDFSSSGSRISFGPELSYILASTDVNVTAPVDFNSFTFGGRLGIDIGERGNLYVRLGGHRYELDFGTIQLSDDLQVTISGNDTDLYYGGGVVFDVFGENGVAARLDISRYELFESFSTFIPTFNVEWRFGR